MNQGNIYSNTDRSQGGQTNINDKVSVGDQPKNGPVCTAPIEELVVFIFDKLGYWFSGYTEEKDAQTKSLMLQIVVFHNL